MTGAPAPAPDTGGRTRPGPGRRPSRTSTESGVGPEEIATPVWELAKLHREKGEFAQLEALLRAEPNWAAVAREAEGVHYSLGVAFREAGPGG